MPIVHELLTQTTNHLPWVLGGLLAWLFAYWHLEDIGAKALGDIVTLILSVIPLGITAITVDVGVARWTGHRYFQATIFFILGAASLVYFVMAYFGLTKIGESAEVQQVIKDYKIRSRAPAGTVSVVIQLLLGAILVLACAILLILGGWQLIQGSRIVGLTCGLFGTALMVFIRHPERNWNYPQLWCSKLKPA